MTTNKTENYQLPQYINSDIFNPLSDLNECFDTLDRIIKNLEDSLSSNNTDLTECKTSIENFKTKLTSFETNLYNNNNNLEKNNERVSLLETHTNEHDEALSEINESINQINEVNTEQNDKIRANNATIEIHEDDLSEHNARLTELEGRSNIKKVNLIKSNFISGITINSNLSTPSFNGAEIHELLELGYDVISMRITNTVPFAQSIDGTQPNYYFNVSSNYKLIHNETVHPGTNEYDFIIGVTNHGDTASLKTINLEVILAN